jgi:hypothetical protein
MKAWLTGMVVGALAITAINKSKNSAKSMIKKGKRAIFRKFEQMLDM